MPRPPVKRNRRRPQDVSTPSQNPNPAQEKPAMKYGNDGLAAAAAGAAAGAEQDMFMSGGLQNGDIEKVHASIPKGSETPISKSQQLVIEVPLPAECVGTGSRPPTRARGYSSAISLAGRKGDPSSRIPNTPGFESSLPSNFRLRPRQPSILQMMHTDESSDFEDDDFLGDLSPQDESTPLNLSRGKSLLLREMTASPLTPSLPSPEGSRKRKRISMGVQDPRLCVGTPDQPIESPSHSVNEASDSSGSETACPPTELDSLSSTMALPMSSSSPASSQDGIPVPHDGADLREASKDGRAAREQPPVGRDKREALTEAPTKLSTAILQEKFLPLRRLRRRKIGYYRNRDDSEDDAGSSDAVGSDEDELSFAASARRRRPKNKGLSKTRTGHVKSNSKLLNREAAIGEKGGYKIKKKSARVTYSSHLNGDLGAKENQFLVDSSELSSPVTPSELLNLDSTSPASKPTDRITSQELLRQAKKFAEIDKWKMEFEDITCLGSQSSPFR